MVERAIGSGRLNRVRRPRRKICQCSRFYLDRFSFSLIMVLVHNSLMGFDRMSALPFAVPIATAAKITGLSPATFKAICIETGVVRMVGNRVLLTSLAAHLGREITPELYLTADRARDTARRYQHDYRNREKNA